MATNGDEWADMSKCGRGQWYLMHCKGVDAINTELKQEYADFVRYVCSKMRCVKCGGHCASFLQSDIGRPEKYFNYYLVGHENEELGCAYHSFLFHNVANLNAGHETLPDFYTWYKEFTGGTSCTTCGGPPAPKDVTIHRDTPKEAALSRLFQARPLK